MQVRDLMAEPAVCCRPDETLAQAVERMRIHDIGTVVVVDDERRIRALVTDRDACLTASDLGKAFSEIRVEDAMSAVTLVCDPDDPVETALSTMQTNSLRRIPVIDPTSRVLGILSLDDVAIEVARELDSGLKPSISPEEVTRTLAEVSKPSHRGHIPIPAGSEAIPRPT